MAVLQGCDIRVCLRREMQATRRRRRSMTEDSCVCIAEEEGRAGQREDQKPHADAICQAPGKGSG